MESGVLVGKIRHGKGPHEEKNRHSADFISLFLMSLCTSSLHQSLAAQGGKVYKDMMKRDDDDAAGQKRTNIMHERKGMGQLRVVKPWLLDIAS